MTGWADRPVTAWLLAGLAFVLAAAGAKPWAGGWNDGSRLATAESLIDRGTLAVDGSVFVRPPVGPGPPGPGPWPPDFPPVDQTGTRDLVRVDGRFYSDKPAVPAVLTAGVYRGLMAVGLPAPGERPDVFCRVAAILVGGLGYAAAVGCMWVVGRRAGLSAGWRLVWLGGFAGATVLPAYTREVNAGILLTGAVAGVAVLLPRATEPGAWGSAVGVGAVAGFGYAVDQGSGPLLLAAVGGTVAARSGSPRPPRLLPQSRRPALRAGPVLAVAAGALPWVAAHHALNYAVGRVWVPVGMVPEYLDWPASPFDRSNMTGVARHTPAGLAWYVVDLLIGRQGFLICNPPLLLAVTAGWWGLVRPGRGRVELVVLLGWCLAAGLLYAALSGNAGGGGLSVRWFVPFLVPGFWLLARLLADRPTFRADFLALAGWGLVLGGRMWTVGAWPTGPVPGLDAVFDGAVATWAVVRTVLVARWALVRLESSRG